MGVRVIHSLGFNSPRHRPTAASSPRRNHKPTSGPTQTRQRGPKAPQPAPTGAWQRRSIAMGPAAPKELIWTTRSPINHGSAPSKQRKPTKGSRKLSFQALYRLRSWQDLSGTGGDQGTPLSIMQISRNFKTHPVLSLHLLGQPYPMRSQKCPTI